MLNRISEVDRNLKPAATLGVDIIEAYSPKGIAKFAQICCLLAESSFDLTNGWDFNLEDHRKKAWAKIK